MTSAYEKLIAKATGLGDRRIIEQVEEVMRSREGGTLDRLSPEAFALLAVDTVMSVRSQNQAKENVLGDKFGHISKDMREKLVVTLKKNLSGNSLAQMISRSAAKHVNVFEFLMELSTFELAKRREMLRRGFKPMEPEHVIREELRKKRIEQCRACQKYLAKIQGSCGCDGSVDFGCPNCGGPCIGAYDGQEPTGPHAEGKAD